MITVNSDGNPISQAFTDAVSQPMVAYDMALVRDGERVPWTIQRATLVLGAGSEGDSLAAGLPVGAVLSAQMDMALFEASDAKVGQELEVRIGVEVSEGAWEFVTVAWVTLTSCRTRNGITSALAQGRIAAKMGAQLGLAAGSATPAQVASAIQAATGVTVSIGAFGTTSTPVTVTDGMTCRDALQAVATRLGGFAAETNDGGVLVSPFASEVTYEMPQPYVLSQVEDGAYEVDGLTVEATGGSLSFGTGRLAVSDPTATQATAQALWEALDGYSYHPGTVDVAIIDPRVTPFDKMAGVGSDQPNLCPFYSVPSGGTEFWISSGYPYYSVELSNAGLNPAGRQLADGWGHYDIDVSGQSASGGATRAYCNIRCLADYAGDWEPSTDYTLLAEFRNVEFHDGATVRSIIFLPVRKTSATQKSIFESPTGAAINVTEDATLRIPLKTYADLSGRTQVTDGYLAFSVGALVSFDVRLSIYEGDYDGPYQPMSDVEIPTQGIVATYDGGYFGTYAAPGMSAEAEDALVPSPTDAKVQQGVDQSKAYTDEEIASIEVGGRNLITLEETYRGSVNPTGTDGGSDTNYFQRRSGYIPATAGETYQMQVWGTPKSGYALWCCIAFYDSSKALVGTRTASYSDVGATHHGISAVAPEGTAYARVAWTAGDNGRAKLEQGTLPTDYTAAPEDLEARPNLTPYGSHDFADVYDATDNPGGFWKITPQSRDFTQLDDGWVHVHVDNSAGTGVVTPNSLRPRQVDGLEGGELVTLLLEVRNNQSSTTGTDTTSRFYVQAANGEQLYGNAPRTANLTNDSISYPLLEGESFVKRMVYVVDTTHLPASGKYGEAFRLGFRAEAGVNLDFELRASLYRGGYGGEYVPFAVSDVSEIRKDAESALAIAEATEQHFWTDDAGAHVTDMAQEDFLAAQAQGFPDVSDEKPYANVLLNSLGMLIRTALSNLVSITRSAVEFFDGLGNAASNMTASFGADGAQIGRTGESHLMMDYRSIQLIDSDGVAYMTMGDLRGHEGLEDHARYEVYTTDSPWEIGVPTNYPVSSVSYVNVNGSDTDDYYFTPGETTIYVRGTNPGDLGFNIWYYSEAADAKQYTLGTRGNGPIGGYSTVIGSNCRASGVHSTAIGSGASATGDNAVAIGNGVAAVANQVVVGRYNNPDSRGVLIVGNGDSEDQRSSALDVDSDGVVWAGAGFGVKASGTSKAGVTQTVTIGGKTLTITGGIITGIS